MWLSTAKCPIGLFADTDVTAAWMEPFWNCLQARGWLWLQEPVVYDHASFHLTSLSPPSVTNVVDHDAVLYSPSTP